MPKIGSLKVSYRRSIQPRQYESMETQVSLDLIFAEGEDPNIDDVITGELDRVQRHVDGRLGIATKPAAKAPAKPLPVADKPATAPVAEKPTTVAKPTGKPAGKKAPAGPGVPAGSKPKPPAPGKKPPVPGKPAAPKPAKPAAPAPKAAEPEEGEIVYTKGDAMKAIASAMTHLAAEGITDGADQIDKIILAYLPDDKPPFSYNRIPDDSLGDFISDLKKLGA